MAKKPITDADNLPKVEEPKPVGRPSLYRPEYCKMVIDHMKLGNSFESFGAVIGCHRDTLYAWEKVHPEFSDSKKEGKELSLKFYEDMGKMIATGQLRRVASEEPVLDSNERPVIDPGTGQVMKRITYAPANANPAAWIFLMKNLHGWRNEIGISGPGGGPIAIKPVEGMTDEELQAKVKEYARKALSQ